MKTKDSLGIFWRFIETNESYHEEVDGLIFYGFWDDKELCETVANNHSFSKIWDEFDVEVKYRKWDDINNADISIEVYIKEWNEPKWFDVLYQSLRWFIENGAKVSWCGSELISPSLLEFDCEEDSEIYAAYCEKTGVVCNSKLNEDYVGLRHQDLEIFKCLIGMKKNEE